MFRVAAVALRESVRYYYLNSSCTRQDVHGSERLSDLLCVRSSLCRCASLVLCDLRLWLVVTSASCACLDMCSFVKESNPRCRAAYYIHRNRIGLRRVHVASEMFPIPQPGAVSSFTVCVLVVKPIAVYLCPRQQAAARPTRTHVCPCTRHRLYSSTLRTVTTTRSLRRPHYPPPPCPPCSSTHVPPLPWQQQHPCPFPPPYCPPPPPPPPPD